MSWIFDTIIGAVPLWAWITGAGVLGFVIFGIVRVYVGSWSVAFSVSLAAVAAVLTGGAVARGRNKGRLAERQRNEAAAQKRSTARKENNDEIDRLAPADLDRRLDRFVRDDDGR